MGKLLDKLNIIQQNPSMGGIISLLRDLCINIDNISFDEDKLKCLNVKSAKKKMK